MDRALDLWKALNKSNGTLPEKYTYVQAEQVAGMIFSIACLIPNIFIIYLICRCKPKRIFYNIVQNISLAHIIHIVLYVPVYVAPVDSITIPFLDSIYFVGYVITNCFALFLMALVFDFYLHWDDLNKYIVIFFWCVTPVFAIISIPLVIYFPNTGKTVVGGSGMIFNILVIFSAYSALISQPGNQIKDDTYEVRYNFSPAMTYSFVLSWFADIFLLNQVITKVFAILCIITVYSHGPLNLYLLTRYDPMIRRYLKLSSITDEGNVRYSQTSKGSRTELTEPTALIEMRQSTGPTSPNIPTEPTTPITPTTTVQIETHEQRERTIVLCESSTSAEATTPTGA